VRVVVAEADFNLNHLDRTWGDVTAAGNLDISASMHE